MNMNIFLSELSGLDGLSDIFWKDVLQVLYGKAVQVKC